MPVDQDRQDTQRQRRRLVQTALTSGFNLADPTSPLARFRDRLEDGNDRTIIANADVDGLTSAMMLASVCEWRIGVLIDKTGYFIAPSLELADLLAEPESVMGIDVFSTRFPNVSNHPILFGTRHGGRVALKTMLDDFDLKMAESVHQHGTINLSAWAGIKAAFGSADFDGLPYKYPLGTAQTLLAALEAINYAPTFYDRQYMPWLVANADGGVDTIRTYAWNAETWWSALAAKVGTHSMSERIYELVRKQDPGSFIDVDRRLRYDEPDYSSVLNTKWNLTSTSAENVAAFVSLVDGLSGWSDPFVGGVESLPNWTRVDPARGVLPVQGLTKAENLQSRLDAAVNAIHANFSQFRDRGVALGWMSEEPDPTSPEPDLVEEETSVGVEPSIADALPFDE